jgi:hypothetical protein
MQSFVLVSATLDRLGATSFQFLRNPPRGSFNASAQANPGLLRKLTAYSLLNRLTFETALNRSR